MDVALVLLVREEKGWLGWGEMDALEDVGATAGRVIEIRKR